MEIFDLTCLLLRVRSCTGCELGLRFGSIDITGLGPLLLSSASAPDYEVGPSTDACLQLDVSSFEFGVFLAGFLTFLKH